MKPLFLTMLLLGASPLGAQPVVPLQWNVQTYGQTLVGAIAACHPELPKVRLYAMPPGSSSYLLAAGTAQYEVGKRAGSEEMAIINGRMRCVKGPRKTTDVGLPLSDAAGNLLGCLTMEVSSEDPKAALTLATQLRDDLSKIIQSREQLFSEAGPVRPDDIYAQHLVDHLGAIHPELDTIGLHLTPSGSSSNIIIATTNRTKIGKKSDPDDLEVMKAGHKPIVEAHDDKQIVDTGLALFDARGNLIGSVVTEVKLVFLQSGAEVKPASAEDLAAGLKLATKLRDELSRQIQNSDQLFSKTAR